MQKNFEIFEIQILATSFVFALVFVVVVSKIFIKTSSPEGTARLCGIPDCLGGCGKKYMWVLKYADATRRMQSLLNVSLCKVKPIPCPLDKELGAGDIIPFLLCPSAHNT